MKKDVQSKRLSLSDFKASSKIKDNDANLSKITGGILGACHQTPIYYASGAASYVSYYDTCK